MSSEEFQVRHVQVLGKSLDQLRQCVPMRGFCSSSSSESFLIISRATSLYVTFVWVSLLKRPLHRSKAH